MGQANIAQGIATAAGVVCTLSPGQSAEGILILLDGKAIATAALNVSVEVEDMTNDAYVAPVTLWGPNASGVTNPVALALGTAQMVYIPGGWSSVRVNIPSFGTATGTFRAVIQSY